MQESVNKSKGAFSLLDDSRRNVKPHGDHDTRRSVQSNGLNSECDSYGNNVDGSTTDEEEGLRDEVLHRHSQSSYNPRPGRKASSGPRRSKYRQSPDRLSNNSYCGSKFAGGVDRESLSSASTRTECTDKDIRDELLRIHLQESHSLSSESTQTISSESVSTEQGLDQERFSRYVIAGNTHSSPRIFADGNSVHSVNTYNTGIVNSGGSSSSDYSSLDNRFPSYLPASRRPSTTSMATTSTSRKNSLQRGDISHTHNKYDTRNESFHSLSARKGGYSRTRRSEPAIHSENQKLVELANSRPNHHGSISVDESNRPIHHNRLTTSDPNIQYSDLINTPNNAGPQGSVPSRRLSSGSSVSSHASRRDDTSHDVIVEEPYREYTSESGINLHHSASTLSSSENLAQERGSIKTTRSSSGRGSQRSQSESAPSHQGDDTNSIGSASSIMLRAQSRNSRLSAMQNHVLEDPDDEILVGDEKDLHDAARRGECEMVEQLLDRGTDVNCRNETDRTPLHWAAGNGHCGVVKVMLERDINIEAADKFGMNALLWASWFGHKKCLEMLLRAGAKSTAKNKNGYTFLHCAAQNNNLMAADILSEDLQEYDRDTTDDAGRTCLHIMAKFGRTEMLQKFIGLECKVNAKDKGGNTPLHLAARSGFPDLVPILVNAGANMEEMNTDHKTPLHLAAEEGRLDCAEELLGLNADVNAETEDEVCPLHLAVSSGHEDMVAVLLDNDADVDAGNKHNQTPLHYAVVANKPSLVHLLIASNADPNVQDARRETPLHLAAENGYFEIADILLHSNINLSLTDQRGKTALKVAARGSYITIVDMILKAERHHLWLNSPAATQLRRNGKTMENVNGSDEDVPDSDRGAISYKPDNNAETQHIRAMLYKLGTKYLKKGEWKKLAFQWGFKDSQVQAIEEQYTGSRSHREHGYRMLLIWLNGCVGRGENPIRSLFEGLVAIHRRDLAEIMRTKANTLPAEKSCIIS